MEEEDEEEWEDDEKNEEGSGSREEGEERKVREEGEERREKGCIFFVVLPILWRRTEGDKREKCCRQAFFYVFQFSGAELKERRGRHATKMVVFFF